MGFISNEQAKRVGIDMSGQDFSKHSSTNYKTSKQYEENAKKLFKNPSCEDCGKEKEIVSIACDCQRVKV